MPRDSRTEVSKRAPAWMTPAALAKLAGVAALLVLALNAPSMMPNAYILSAAVVILNYAVTATAWNVMGGLTGYISFGHAAYFGLGAYGTALLVGKANVPSFLALGLAVVIVAVISAPIGFAALRVRGASFVITTIALVLILLLVFQSWSYPGGSNGLTVARPFPDLLRAEHHLRFYYLYLALLVVVMVCWWGIDRSRFGMGLKAIREDEDKAESLGVPTIGYKLVASVISAAFTGASGGMYALWFGDLDPVFQFSILVGAYMVLMSLLGGVRSLFGPLLGAIIVGFALEYFKLEFGESQFHLVATGLVLMLVVLFMPDGIIPAVAQLYHRIFGGGETSIREVTAEELLEDHRSGAEQESEAPASSQDPAGSNELTKVRQ